MEILHCGRNRYAHHIIYKVGNPLTVHQQGISLKNYSNLVIHTRERCVTTEKRLRGSIHTCLGKGPQYTQLKKQVSHQCADFDLFFFLERGVYVCVCSHMHKPFWKKNV